jgi:hypothetical protein
MFYEYAVRQATEVARLKKQIKGLLTEPVTTEDGNPDRHHKLWNIESTERYYILHMQVLLECYYI